MMDPYDIDWRALSFGEILTIQELAQGELKRRNFKGPDSDQRLSADKRAASIAFQMRILSRSLRSVCRDLKAVEKAKPIPADIPDDCLFDPEDTP